MRAASDSPALDLESWRVLAELGVFGVAVAESRGGMGLGLTDAAIVCEELGRALVPGPVVPTMLAAHIVDEAVDGRAIVATVDSDDTVLLAEHLDAATHLIVVADDGLFAVSPADCVVEPLDRPLDPLTPLWSVTLPKEKRQRVGSAADAALWRSRGAVLTSAFQVGVGNGALDLAVRYATERVQFGRAIGSFQAVKHMLAETLVKIDVARAAAYAAALEMDDAAISDAGEAVSSAKALADQAAAHSGRCGVQVHGGMGFTWEVLAHLYLKRAWLLATCFGPADDHTLRLATAVAKAAGVSAEV